MYEFGFGLSYSKFDIEILKAETVTEESEVGGALGSHGVSIDNGTCAGKEVQITICVKIQETAGEKRSYRSMCRHRRENLENRREN